MALRWVPRGHRVIDPADPDLRTIADVGFALGLRFEFDVRPRRYAWQGPWRLEERGRVWRRDYGNGRTLEFPMPNSALVEHMSDEIMGALYWMTQPKVHRAD